MSAKIENIFSALYRPFLLVGDVGAGNPHTPGWSPFEEVGMGARSMNQARCQNIFFICVFFVRFSKCDLVYRIVLFFSSIALYHRRMH
jgi:hypothetical protein